MTLTDAEISNNGNAGTDEGGGIHNKKASTLNSVTISGNRSDFGGGIHNDNTATSLSLTNVTVSGNTGVDTGGGLNNENWATINNATFTLNTASTGAGIFNLDAASDIDIRNTIVAGNLTNPDVEGDFNSLGNNLIGDEGSASSGFTDGVSGDQVGTSGSPIVPLLESLKNNGGFTKTHMPLGGSPAVDSGTAAGAPGTDQRGTARPLDGDGDTTAAVDIGAVEVVPDKLVHVADTGDDQETSAENRGSHQAVAMAANGNYVVVWSSDNEDGSGWGVFGQRFDASGAPVGSKFQVNDTFNNNQRWATVAMDAAGNFVVVWTSENQDSTTHSVYARGFNADATEAFAEFKVNTYDVLPSDAQKNPSIAMASDGRFVIAWEGEGLGVTHGILFRRFNADGSPRDAADRVANAFDRGMETTPTVAINDSGDFAIVWAVGNNLYVRPFGDDGNPVWVEEDQVNSFSSSGGPDVAIDGTGRITVVWQSSNILHNGVWMRTYASDGTPGLPVLVDENPSEDSTNPSITMDSAGNRIVVYEGSGDGDGFGVFARKYDAGGTALTGQFQINQTATGTQHMASVAMLDSDNFVVVWSGNGPDDSNGVFMRQFGDFTPANNTPVINNATFALDENSSNGTAVGNVPVTDPDAGDSHVYSITAGNTGSAFAIDNSGNITVANSAALNFEITPVFTLTVLVQDQGGTGLTDTATVTINLNDINDAPVINNSTFSVDENAANDTLVGTVAATDSGHAVNYTMLYWVDLQTDELRRINLDGTGNELLAIQADGTAATGMRSVAVDDVNGKVYWVNNNSDDIWRANLDGSSPERILSGIVWPMGIAVDAAGEKIYWFDNNSSELWWADLDGANAAALITAGINHPKALAIDASGGKLYWTDNGLKTIMRANLDGSNLETVVTGLDDPFGIALDTAAGKVYWAEATLGEIQRADMAVGAIAETVITGLSEPRAVTVDTINGKLYYANAGADRIERANIDGSAIEIVTATGDWPTGLAIGPPVQNLTYAITGGNTNGAFTIDSVTGTITIANSSELDFETTSVFNLTVTVTDAGGLVDSATITINLNDINEAPSAVALDNTTVAENDDGAIIGNLTTTDPDSGDTHTYTVDDARFEVVAGQLKLIAGQTLDFETEPSVNLNITSTDAGGLSIVQGFTLTVSNVNETPSAVALDNTTVAENDDGAIIGNLTTTDPDSGDTHTYTVDDARFEVVAGQLKLIAGQTLDFESEPSVNLNITSTDAGGLSIVQGFTLTVNNVNDVGSVTIDNMSPAQGDTLTANVIDPDGISGAITYQWFSDGAVIGGATGKTYTTTQSDVGAVMTVTAIYTDDQVTAESLTSAPTAPVTNVNDTPIAVNDNLNAIEDQAMTFTSVTDLLGNDSDIDGDTLTLSSFSQPANGSLADNGDGTVTYTSAGNFSGVDSFTYTISDSNGGTAAGAAIIVVTPVGDTPQVMNVSTDAGVQSGLINLDRNANDGAEVTHFKISGITNGTLYLADGVTRIDNNDFITVGQGQAGLRFTPATNGTADGSFNVESSEDGVSVASQSGIATSIISILTTAPQPSEPVPSLPPSGPEEVVSEETEQEESEELEDVADETDVQTVADDMASVEAPQNAKAPGIKKASLVPGISVFKRADLNSNHDRTPGRSTFLSPQTLKKLVESENLGELKTALGKLDITILPPDVYELVRGSLDAVQEEMGKEILIGKTVVGSAIATSVGLSAGYVVWMLKGGSLLASVLSSLPAWQLADPLAILVGTKEDEDEDDDTLETIIKDGSMRNEDKERNASESDKHKKESTKR